ncbi:unnamed protein product [Lactuca virosa]|uniref:Uncharacterized protein n=1 Tax=Lactuca virosa TaxID=75947 RepID=A0AAU9PGM9_9ASTR|nr:unnamed protein product [Lactuca virosa]
MADGKMYKVGLVEYTDDWSSFHSAPFDKAEKESDEDVNDVGEEDYEAGVSETWMMEDNNDDEEGEIRLESSPKKASLSDRTHGDNNKSDDENRCCQPTTTSPMCTKIQNEVNAGTRLIINTVEDLC